MSKSAEEQADEAANDAWLDPEIQPQDPVGLPTFRILYSAGYLAGHAAGVKDALESEAVMGLVEAIQRDVHHFPEDRQFALKALGAFRQAKGMGET